MVRPNTLQLGYSAHDLSSLPSLVPSHTPSPFTSPVEASFRLDVAADAPVPDLVPSQALQPPRPSHCEGHATFPRAARAHLGLGVGVVPPALPSGVGIGGVGMVRSVSQPVLTGAEHAQYTAHRAASLGRIAARYGYGREGRRRPSLPNFGLGRLSDGSEEDEGDGDGDVEMATSSDTPDVHHSHSHPLRPTHASRYHSNFTTLIQSRSYNPSDTYRTHPPGPHIHRDIHDAPGQSQLQSQSYSYQGPTYNLNLASSDVPTHSETAFPSVTSTTLAQRSATPERDRLEKYPRRTPSPGSSYSPSNRSPSRLLPASGRFNGVGGSPTPSTASRAAWRTTVRLVPRVKVEEAA